MGREEVERGNWGKQLDFILSCVGYAVGLGNVWRFPYLAYRNGGATFLFPYIIMLAVAGLPLFFIELALGQFASEGPITVWKMSPFFTGIGVAMVMISGVVSIYYNVIIMYAIYYMWVSFVNLDDALPWANCNNWWRSEGCRDVPYPDFKNMNETEAMAAITGDVYKDDCLRGKMADSEFQTAVYDAWGVSSYSELNSTIIRTELFKPCAKHFISPADDFWTNYVLRLNEAKDFSDLGGISLKNILTLALAWILIFFCLMKGVKSSGKVVYFTATFPYVILIVLLVRGVTLDGHMKGIMFYIVPKWEKLTDAKVWGDAATQIFYSLGVGFGGLLTMASYNKFKNNCYRDAIMVALINCGTSIFAGFAVFALLGHMAHVTNQDVGDVASDGPGLAFVAYPDGITRLPASSLWAFLFFFMILTLGLDSQFAMMETVISGISDMFPHTLRRRKTLFTFVACVVGFLLGIPQTTKGGIWVLTLFDWYSGSYNLMFIALCELICLMYVYGYKRFGEDVEMMVGFKPNIYWLATWLVITPLAIAFCEWRGRGDGGTVEPLLDDHPFRRHLSFKTIIQFIIVIGAIQYTKAYYGNYEFEGWVQGIGWVMVCVPLLAIVLVAIFQACRLGVPNCFKPTKSWGPSLPENRTGRYASVNLPFQINSVSDGKTDSVGGFDNVAYVSEKGKEQVRIRL